MRLIKYIKGLFQKTPIQPVFDTEIQKEIKASIEAQRAIQAEKGNEIEAKLKSLVDTLFTTKVSNFMEFDLVFKKCDKNWRVFVRNFNSTNKLLSANKDAFKNNVRYILQKNAEKQSNEAQK